MSQANPFTFHQKSKSQTLEQEVQIKRPSSRLLQTANPYRDKIQGILHEYKGTKNITNELMQKRKEKYDRPDESDNTSRKTLIMRSKTMSKPSGLSFAPAQNDPNALSNKANQSRDLFRDYCNKVMFEMQAQSSVFNELNLNDAKAKTLLQQMFMEAQEFEQSKQKCLHQILENERTIFKLKKRIEKRELKQIQKDASKHAQIQKDAFMRLSSQNAKLLSELKSIFQSKRGSKSVSGKSTF